MTTVASPAPSSPQSFPAVNILRGLAALLVLCFHVTLSGKWGLPLEGFWVVGGRGWIGVDLFFVISGFVIGWAGLKAHAAQGAAFRRDFAWRRCSRILPLYLLTCLIFLLLVKPDLLVAPGRVLAWQVASHLLFVHNLHPDTYWSVNWVTWSIALEVQFYGLMLLAIPWVSRANPWRLLGGAALFAWAFRWATTLVWVPGSALPSDQLIAASQLPAVIDQFACGICLALLLHRGPAGQPRLLRVGWANFALWTLLAAGLLTAAVRFMLVYSDHWNHSFMVVAWRPLLTLGWASLLAAALVFPWASLWLLAPLRYLGDISYGIYLWHMLIIHTLTTHHPQLQGYRFLAYVLVCTLLLAASSWHGFEKLWVHTRRRPRATPSEPESLSHIPACHARALTQQTSP